MNRTFLVTLTALLFLVVVGGLLWLAIASDNAVSALLSFAAGLSMIFLPCTLPLAFVIVPIAMKERAGKGLGLALAFGFGLAVMLMIYGIATAFLGGYLGLDQFTRAMFVVAGAMALLFALTELNLFHIPLPVFSHRVPNWISQGYAKTFALGLFLGNAGIGCPNPAFYVLLTYIASTGDVLVGGWLGLVHGVGRAAPLILLVLLAILGIQKTNWLSTVSQRLSLWTGGALTVVGSFILTYGLLGMHWWENSIFHAGWNQFVINIAPALAEAPDHPVAQGLYEAPAAAGWWMLILLILIPLVWYKIKHGSTSSPQGGVRTKVFVSIITILLALGIAASAGWTTVEHGHGTLPSAPEPHEHSEPIGPHTH